MYFPKEIGDRIKFRRNELDMTLDEVAAEVGVSKSTIQRYENGLIGRVKIPVIESIAAALNVNPAWLIGQTDDPIDYDAPDLVASIPKSYRSACNWDIKRAYQAMQVVDDYALRENAEKKYSSLVLTDKEEDVIKCYRKATDDDRTVVEAVLKKYRESPAPIARSAG